jgi:hypothetical protein
MSETAAPAVTTEAPPKIAVSMEEAPSGGPLTVQPATSLNTYAFEPVTFTQLMWWARKIFAAGIAPASCDTLEKVIITIQTGRELGFTLMQSFRWIYIVNGRPALWTAAKVALVQQSPFCEYFHVVESTDTTCTVKFKRKNNPERTVRWSITDAQRAGLLTKETDPKSPWVKYPRKMIMWRCESDACDEGFPDVAGGLDTVEAARDQDIRDVDHRVEPRIVLPGGAANQAADDAPPADSATTTATTGTPVSATAPVAPPVHKVNEATGEGPRPATEGDTFRACAAMIEKAVKDTEIAKARVAIVAGAVEKKLTMVELRELFTALLARCQTATQCNYAADAIADLKAHTPEDVREAMTKEYRAAKAERASRTS